MLWGIKMYKKRYGYVYIIKLEMRNHYGYKKHDRYGRNTSYYVGYTGRSIYDRFKEHLRGIHSGYLSKFHRYDRKFLVYVELVDYIPHKKLPYINKGNYHPVEYEIKQMSREEKITLINSDRNMLYYCNQNCNDLRIVLKNGWTFHNGKLYKNYCGFNEENKMVIGQEVEK